MSSRSNNSQNFATCDFKSPCFNKHHRRKEQNKREPIYERVSDKYSNWIESQKHQWNKVSQSRSGNPKDENLLKAGKTATIITEGQIGEERRENENWTKDGKSGSNRVQP